jgi:hypothetical protein
MITVFPLRTRWAARSRLRTELSRLERSMITWPPAASAQPKNGIQVSSRLATKRNEPGSVAIIAAVSQTLWWLAITT